MSNTACRHYLSVNDAAAMLGLTVGRIRQLLNGKELTGRKLNKQAWIIDRRDLERYAKKTCRELAKSH